MKFFKLVKQGLIKNECSDVARDIANNVVSMRIKEAEQNNQRLETTDIVNYYFTAYQETLDFLGDSSKYKTAYYKEHQNNRHS